MNATDRDWLKFRVISELNTHRGKIPRTLRTPLGRPETLSVNIDSAFEPLKQATKPTKKVFVQLVKPWIIVAYAPTPLADSAGGSLRAPQYRFLFT